MNMKKIELVQWGKFRSIVLITYPDTNEKELLMINNDYLRNQVETEWVI